jgi:hypothetical protein
MDSLFTPPPSDRSAPMSPLTPPKQSRKRFFLSYVAVPPFPAGRTQSDYIRISRKKRARPVDLHQTLGEALQASLVHNAKVGALHTTRRDKGGNYQVQKKRPRTTQRNAIAGPSSVSVAAGSPRENIKKIYRKRDREQSCDDDIPRKKMKTYQDTESKRPTTGGDVLHKRSGSRAYTKYDVEEDSLQLFVGSIPPLPAEVLHLNTRFVLAATHAKENDREQTIPARSNKKLIGSSHGRQKPWFTWPPSRPSLLDAVREEFFAGGPVKQEHDGRNYEVEGEALLNHIGTKRRRELSPKNELRARTKEKEGEFAKRHIRAVEPLGNDDRAPRPKPRHHEPNPKTPPEAASQRDQVRKERLVSPSGHRSRPPDTRVVQEAPLARDYDGREGTIPSRSNEVVSKASERHKDSQERAISASNRHRPPKPSEVEQETSSKQHKAGREVGRISPSDRHRPRKPSSGVTQEAPSGRDEVSQEGVVSPSDPHGLREPSSRVTQETLSRQDEAGQERTVSPSDPLRPSKPSSRVVQETAPGRDEAGHGIASPSGGHRPRKPSTSTKFVQETSSEHGARLDGMLSSPGGHRPSAKALGKQRALSPLIYTRFGPEVSLPSPQFTANHDTILQTTNQQSSYALALSNGLTSLRTNFFAPSTRLGAAPFMPQVPLNDSDNFLVGSLDSPCKTYDLDQLQMGADNPFLSQSITLGGLPTSPEFEEAMINPWLVDSNTSSSMSNLPPSVMYGDGTINPSLLGGMQEVDPVHFTPPGSPAFPSPPLPAAHSPSPWDVISCPRLDRSNSSSRSPTPSSSSSSSSSSESSSLLLSPSSRSLSSIRRNSVTASQYVKSEQVTTTSLRPRPLRHSVRQVPHDMVRSSEINSCASSGNESEPIADGTKRAEKSSTVKKIGPLKKRQRQGQMWPLCEEREYCHQCRTSSYIVKLICSCEKRYCVRCLTLRYVIVVSPLCFFSLLPVTP